MCREFPSDDENIVFIVIVKLLESYFREFDLPSYKKNLLPLAKELYEHHVNSSDLVLLNSLLRCSNTYASGKKKHNPSLLNYFRNLEEAYTSRFAPTNNVLLEKEDYVSYFKEEDIRLHNISQAKHINNIQTQ